MHWWMKIGLEFRTTEFDPKIVLVTSIFTLSDTNCTIFKLESSSNRMSGMLHT